MLKNNRNFLILKKYWFFLIFFVFSWNISLDSLENYVSVKKLSNSLKFKIIQDDINNIIKLVKDDKSATLMLDSPYILLNDEHVASLKHLA